MENRYLQINEFYGGIARDKKARTRGVALNMEELDIFTNGDYFQAEQILSSDSMPASTEIYSYTADNSDHVWGYGKETSGNKIRLVKVTSGGDTNPGAFSTVFTSADATDLAYLSSPIQYFRQDNGNQDFLYYVSNASGTVKLRSYDITAGTESEQDSGATNMTLSKLDGSYDRIVMKVMFGELYITNGQFISKVDKDGVFTEDAFTLPNGWDAVDIIPVSDVAIILARNINRNINESKGFWWDLTAALQVDDSFDIPMGGPQWMVNHKETIKICCAQNGIARFFQLSGAFPGALPLEIPGFTLDNVAAESSTQPISPQKCVSVKDRVLYFGMNKTDKTGIYAIGQLDSDKPQALILSKRFNTTDYSNHTPYALHIQGPNYYAAYDDNGTATNMRCESQNSPTRSSNAIYESIIIDDGDSQIDKVLDRVHVMTQPLAASTDVDVSLASDYGSYSAITRADGTSLNTTSAVLGEFLSSSAKAKTYQIKLQLTSATTNSPKVTGIGLKMKKQRINAHN